MRILELSDLYPPVIGGLERELRLLSQEFSRRGHQVEVVTLGRPDLPAEERDGDVKIHRLVGWSRHLQRFYEDPERNFHPTVPDPGITRQLGELISRFRPDVIHARGWIVYSLLAVRRRAAPIVVTLLDHGLVCAKKTLLHNEVGDCTGPSLGKCVRCTSRHIGTVKGIGLPLGLAASSQLHRRVEHFVALSESVSDLSVNARRGVPTSVIPSLVPDDPASGESTHRPSFLPEQDGYVLFVGALGRHKGIDVLMDAVEGLDTPVVVLGPRRADTPTVTPPNVIMSFDVSHPDVMYAWNRASVGVVPSTWREPFGQVAVEAMAAGTPVVASSTGGLKDIVVDGETGWLVPPGDATALRTRIDTLLADEDLRLRMGAAGRRRASRYGVSVVASEYESLFDALVRQ